MTEYEKGLTSTFVRWFFTLWTLAIIVTATVFALGKVGGAMFDSASDGLPPSTSYDEKRSLDMCEAAHGTPVLESNGTAYKSCAINGKSDTRNTVK